MSLELEIKNLTLAVQELTRAITEQVSVPKAKESAKPKAKETVEPEAPKVETPKEVGTVTEQDLQALCMSIVQKDRSLGGKIKEAIGKYDGAKTIKQVNAENYPELKGILEGLLNG